MLTPHSSIEGILIFLAPCSRSNMPHVLSWELDKATDQFSRDKLPQIPYLLSTLISPFFIFFHALISGCWQ